MGDLSLQYTGSLLQPVGFCLVVAWDLSSLIEDQIHTHCIGNVES